MWVNIYQKNHSVLSFQYLCQLFLFQSPTVLAQELWSNTQQAAELTGGTAVLYRKAQFFPPSNLMLFMFSFRSFKNPTTPNSSKVIPAAACLWLRTNQVATEKSNPSAHWVPPNCLHSTDSFQILAQLLKPQRATEKLIN